MFIVSFLSSLYRYNDGSIPSTATADGNTLTLSTPSVDDSGNYKCSFRNVSYTFALMITPAPTTSVATPDNSAGNSEQVYIIVCAHSTF